MCSSIIYALAISLYSSFPKETEGIWVRKTSKIKAGVLNIQVNKYLEAVVTLILWKLRFFFSSGRRKECSLIVSLAWLMQVLPTNLPLSECKILLYKVASSVYLLLKSVLLLLSDNNIFCVCDAGG